MIIRNFKESDRAEFCSMCSNFYSSDAVAHTVNLDNFTRTFEEIIRGNPFMRGLIIEDRTICAGYAQLSFTWSNEAGGCVVWLEELYIKPEYRGMQLGTQLIEFIKNEYSDAARIRLEVTEDNTGAMRLYEKLGFTKLEYLQMIIDR